MMRISEKYPREWWEQHTVERWVATRMSASGMRVITTIGVSSHWGTKAEVDSQIRKVLDMEPSLEARLICFLKQGSALAPMQMWFDDWCESCHNYGKICLDDFLGLTKTCGSCDGVNRRAGIA